MKRKSRQILAILLVLVTCISTMDISAFAAGINGLEQPQTEETTSDEALISMGDVATEGADGNDWDGTTTQSVYEGENYKVTFSLSGYWNGGYNGNIKIENTGESVIENWYLGYDSDNVITNIWNAEVDRYESGQYIIKNAGWNQDIAVGGAVEFGFSGNENFLGFPSEYSLLGNYTETDENDYMIKYSLSSDWGSGFVGTISITNNTDTTIEDWTLDFDFGRTITNIWDGVLETQEGNHYVVKNAAYNSNIAAGETVSFGFGGISGSKEMEPYGYKLHKYEIKMNYAVAFDAGDPNATNIPEAQFLANGGYVTEPGYPEREGYLFLGWYKDKDFSEYFDFENSTINKDTTLYARWFYYLCETDADGDGIVDSLEEVIGTSINSNDTDGDGLSDLTEVDILYTDPTMLDTDGNGINDGDEDYDADRLTNKDETEYGTDPAVADTDNDKLSDYDEKVIYGTEPLKADTDEDGVSDGKEIELGTDPLTLQTSFQVSVSSENAGQVKASVDIELTGAQVETLNVEVAENEFLFPETIPGYIGEAYDFSVDGTFDAATIHFEFAEELLETKDFEPIIYYFNEEEQQLEPLDTTVSGNVASARTNHFSTYILINRVVYEDSYQWIDEWDTEGFNSVELVLVIDDSGSMTSNDRTNQRLAVAQSLVEKLPADSKVGVIKFTSSATALTSTLTEDKEEAKSFLNSSYFKSSGGTYMYTAIKKGISLFESTDEKTLKMMVVLSDGETSDTSQHSTVVSLANNTAGMFYLASYAGQLEEIYNDINNKIDIGTDSDSDGIADYYEDNMVIFNGVKIKLDKNNPDTDGDGLLDGEEIVELKYKYNEDKTKVRVTGKFKSNPASIDTDGDGLYDNAARIAKGVVVAPIDPEPANKNGLTGFWDNHVEGQQCGVASTEYNNDYGLKIPELSALIKEELGVSIPNSQEIADACVEIILKSRESVNSNKYAIRTAALIIKRFCKGKAATVAGAYLLNFVYDEDKAAYHSQPDTWQRYFGYNDFYDDVFRIGSYMHYKPVEFSVGTEEYVLWLWKGDYWNLHSGAEMGLYTSPDIYSGTEQYDAVDFEVPMNLSLYNYYGKSSIENIFNWSPEEDQWWITGFSGQNRDFIEPDRELMAIIGTVDLSEHTEIYASLKDKYDKDRGIYIKYNLEMIFDDKEHMVWINWYEGVTQRK